MIKGQEHFKVRDLMYDFDEKIEAGSRGEWISENLCPCDNVVVLTRTN